MITESPNLLKIKKKKKKTKKKHRYGVYIDKYS